MTSPVLYKSKRCCKTEYKELPGLPVKDIAYHVTRGQRTSPKKSSSRSKIHPVKPVAVSYLAHLFFCVSLSLSLFRLSRGLGFFSRILFRLDRMSHSVSLTRRRLSRFSLRRSLFFSFHPLFRPQRLSKVSSPPPRFQFLPDRIHCLSFLCPRPSNGRALSRSCVIRPSEFPRKGKPLPQPPPHKHSSCRP